MRTRRRQGPGGGVIEFEMEEGGGEVEFDPAVFDDVQAYASERSSRGPALYEAIEKNTVRYLPTGAHMVSGGTQGRLLASLAGMARSGRVLEIGTFTGMATCCFAEGVEAGGARGEDALVVTLERDKIACGIARYHLDALREGYGEEAGRRAGELEDDDVVEFGEPEEHVVKLKSGARLVSRRVSDALAYVEGGLAGMMDEEEVRERYFSAIWYNL